MIIYKITNLVNNKIYIGQTRNSLNSRWSCHIRDSKYASTGIDSAIRKYGKENFKVEVLDDTASSLEELNNLEIYYIKLYNSTNNKIGYNQTTGGGGISGYTHNEESKYRCGSSFRGKKRIKTVDQVDKWRITFYKNNNHIKSEEFCRKQSENLKLAYASGRRKPNGKGVGGRKPMSEEEKIRNSVTQSGAKKMFHKKLEIITLVYKDEISDRLSEEFEFCTKSNNFIWKDYKYVKRKEFKMLKPF